MDGENDNNRRQRYEELVINLMRLLKIKLENIDLYGPAERSFDFVDVIFELREEINEIIAILNHER